uniref:Hydroquinone glucosyltransferase n=1 Tax=Rauvolfia serpentina TaxID=4060 RepID=HQGT_RAUSE|nr:RecName: Full=Hydroquinone glucosyltransferase; AltName: Full=Arbutin synthase [Rauvolfia serpentina]CAC35167.1 arbutin synthase [Rauvolfia serpentina]
MEHTPHIAMVPTPGMGHLIPLVEFAKRLVLRHNFGVTFIIPTDGPLPKAQKSFLDALPAGVNYVLLPPVSFDDLPADVRIETRICLTITRSLPFVRDAVKTLLATTKLAALVVDLFGTDAFDVAIEFKVSPYIFYPTTAMCLSLFFHLPKLDQMVSCEYRDVPEPLQIPGCIPIHGKDFLDPAQDRKNDAYKCLLHQAKRYRLAEGIMVNTFNDLEPGPLKALQEEDQGKPPVYPIGPLIRADSSSKVDDCECLKWLDDQPRGSVLFISFGSGGAVSHNQFIELALGLEMSEQRFLWVVRSPNDKIANATYFSIQNQNDALAYLPEGFLERTKGRCLLVPSWAPQTEILSHGSTGGFLTHCGWNSILESVVNGVPLIAWPLYAEQKMNAVMLTEGLKVALRPKAGENGLIGRVEIANAVKGLMEGEEGKKFRSTMKDLKDAASRALSDDGSSTKALAELACKWENKISST